MPADEETHLERAVELSGSRKAWLARVCGVDPSTFSRWLSGERKVDPANQVRLAALLHRTPGDLFCQPEDDGGAFARRAAEPEIAA